MIRFLIRALVFLASSALGLLAASAILGDDFRLTATGFVATVVIFAVAQSVLAPFIASVTARYASAFLGGVGLLSTFVALALASWITGGVTVDGATAWVVGTLVVWLVTALGSLLLPLVFLRNRRDAAGKPPVARPRASP